MRRYVVSLQGLGFDAQSAVVVAEENIISGDFTPLLDDSSRILKPLRITLDRWVEPSQREEAKEAAWKIAYNLFLEELHSSVR